MSILADLASLKWGDWFYTLFKAGISAGAAVIAANPLAALAGAPAFDARQLGIFALAAAVVAMAGVLQKSPLPDRNVQIALVSGVHTTDDVKKIADVIKGDEPLTPAAAAAILGKPAPQTIVQAPKTVKENS